MQLSNKTLALPIIQGGMGIGVSLGNLAGSVAKNGAMGIISTANPGFSEDDFWIASQEANARALAKEIKKAKEIAGGSGLVGINAMVATKDYESAVKTAVKNGVDVIISGAGLPLALPELVGDADVLLAPIISSPRAAALICRHWKKRYNRLPDFFVLEGAGAGGHLGFSLDELENNTALSLQQLLSDVIYSISSYGDIPVFVGGSVFDADDIKKYLDLGAAGVQIATRFIATEECDASDEYKQRIIQAKQEDIMIVKSPVGMPGRALRSPLMQRVEQLGRIAPSKCARCLVPCNAATCPYCITNALIDGVLGKWETGLFFCGENAHRVNEIVPVKQLLDELSQAWR